MIHAIQQSVASENAVVLERELAWLAEVIDASIRLYLGNECRYRDVREIDAPRLKSGGSPYANLLLEQELSTDERIVLMLALAPHLRPQILDPFLVTNSNLDRVFTEFGGVTMDTHRGFFPTVETAAFTLGGYSLERRFAVQQLLEPDRTLRRLHLIELNDASSTLFASPLVFGKQYHGPLTAGSPYRPAFTGSFPEKRLLTNLEWSDLVLAEATMDEVEEIRAWIDYRAQLLDEWQLAAKVKPGFRSLFYGPPGTGKTLSASLLGKVTGLDVYRVDLSLIVSKWVGETEKNLSAVFDEAEKNNWLLFFDEADSLFSKRTQTSSSHDRYANQEVSYLLQRIEDFAGVVILATNLKSNIDEAFARRFQSMIFFPMPSAAERLRLWNGAFAQTHRLDGSVDLEQLATESELSGGAVVNVLRFAALKALRRGEDKVNMQDLRQGIRREFRKHGKML